MVKYYDKTGNEISPEQYSDYHHDVDYWRIARDILPDGKVVSTVWLGIDHNYEDTGDPIIFETMVFPSEDSFSDLACFRYRNEADAIEGHKDTVTIWSMVNV